MRMKVPIETPRSVLKSQSAPPVDARALSYAVQNSSIQRNSRKHDRASDAFWLSVLRAQTNYQNEGTG